MGAGSFVLDTDGLDEVIADLEGTEAALETLTADVERQIRALHELWEGVAAQAQRAAQAEWEQGMRDMRAALRDLRSAARTAHGNYTGAARANLEMWQGLS